MREVNFARDTMYGIADLLGIDTGEDVMKDQARAWCGGVKNHVRRGWGFWEWPELEITEERAFRQVWYDSVTYLEGHGDESEVYYIPTGLYYRATGDPDPGELPSDLVHWEEILAADLDYRIAYQQYGKQAIDRFVSIDNPSPRTAGTRIMWGFMPSGYGIDLSWNAGPTVWVTYIPRPPEFTTETYSAARTYSRGNLVLDLVTGDCYRALRASTNQPLALGSYWLRQVMPYVLSEYVKYAVAAEQAGDVQQKAQWGNEAEDRLKSEVDKLIGQGQVSFYRRPRGVPALQGVSGYGRIPLVVG